MCGTQERDLHGLTAIQTRQRLDDCWGSGKWLGLKTVPIIHGNGEVLKAVTRHWAEEKGIPWAPERGNPGCTILHPGRRLQTAVAPPVRPLAHPVLHHIRRTAAMKPVTPINQPAGSGESDEALMTRAFAEIQVKPISPSSEDVPTGIRALDRPELRELLQKKSEILPEPPKTKPVQRVAPVPSNPSVDPMEAEMERLAAADLRALRRAKLEG